MTEDALNKSLKTGPYGKCAYLCDNNVMDTQIVNMAFENDILVSMVASAFTPIGRRIRIMGTKGYLEGDEETIRTTLVEEKLKMANAFFGGGHELIIARHHFVEGATHNNQLASSGTMTPEEHYQYFRFTIDALRDIYLSNRYVRYVAVFQNWLQPAGASFDHLHKQLVAIDERGVSNDMEIRLVRANPNIYNEEAVNYAAHRNLVFAENDHAIAFAGFGHRFPTLEVYSINYLRMILAVSVAGVLISYCVWAFETSAESTSSWPLYELSIVPMLMALMRYLLVLEEGGGSAPEEVFTSDRLLLFLGFCWLVVYGLAVYVS